MRKLFPLMAIAIALRLAVVGHPGHESDVAMFQAWSTKGATFGVTDIYKPSLPGMVPDYPPAQLYLYTLVGHAQSAAERFVQSDTVRLAILKSPAIIADLLIGLLLFLVLRGRLGELRGLAAAGIFYLHPVVWHNSAIWGQTDAIYTLLILSAVLAAGRDRLVLAGAIAGIAALTKFQALIFLPLFAAFVLPDVRRSLRFGQGVAIGAAVVAIPFLVAGTTGDIFAAYRSAFTAYPILSSNAFNLWWAIFGADAGETLDSARFAGITYKMWGLGFFSIALAIVAWQIRDFQRRRANDDPEIELMTAAAALALCFFLLPTQIHERYLFPFVALALPWALRSRFAFASYTALSVILFLNVLRPVPLDLRSYILFLKFPWIPVTCAIALVLISGPTLVHMLRRSTYRGAPSTQ